MAHRTHALLALLAVIALALPWNTLCLQLPDAEAEFLYNFWEQNPNARFPTNWQYARTYWACDENWEGVTCEDFGTYYRIVALYVHISER
jgi:4-amino-4-deoxy-L-arabinose transferase-like glycosyltransferase